eukprot:366931-Pyramimonas_sp.AAC.1
MQRGSSRVRSAPFRWHCSRDGASVFRARTRSRSGPSDTRRQSSIDYELELTVELESSIAQDVSGGA